MTRALVLDVVPERIAVCRLPPDAPIPPPGEAPLWSATRSTEELSLVVPEEGAPAGARVEGGFRALRVRGPLDFSLTGILAELTGTLAAAEVSVFALSTFDTDWLLVQEESLDRARAALAARGHRVEG